MDAETVGDSVHSINMLTVIASESYKGFVSDLQSDIKTVLYDIPTKATAEYFTGKTIIIGEQQFVIDEVCAKEIYRYLIKNDYIDNEDKLTDEYRTDLANNCLAELPIDIRHMASGIHNLIQGIFDESILDDMIENGNRTKIPNELNDNFYKKEFQTLWSYINHKYAYTVEFDSNELIVEHISYDQIEGDYDSTIFTAEKNSQGFEKAFRAEKHIQDYVFTDGSADKSVERRFAQDLDAAKEVCVYAKLPKGFAIPTPVGNYSPDWAIAFNKGAVKHIYFIAETKGTMESLNLRPIEQAKISCAKKLFNEISTNEVKYHDVDSYQSLMNIMNSL